jgi:hypothetical protein
MDLMIYPNMEDYGGWIGLSLTAYLYKPWDRPVSSNT